MPQNMSKSSDSLREAPYTEDFCKQIKLFFFENEQLKTRYFSSVRNLLKNRNDTELESILYQSVEYVAWTADVTKQGYEEKIREARAIYLSWYDQVNSVVEQASQI
jgi:hypothetical protein